MEEKIRELENRIAALEKQVQPIDKEVVLNYLMKNLDTSFSQLIQTLKETAREVPVQEQYVGKCKTCGANNKLNISQSYSKLLKFCMECGEPIEYTKMAH